jgi:hypothetical protein
LKLNDWVGLSTQLSFQTEAGVEPDDSAEIVNLLIAETLGVERITSLFKSAVRSVYANSLGFPQLPPSDAAFNEKHFEALEWCLTTTPLKKRGRLENCGRMSPLDTVEDFKS